MREGWGRQTAWLRQDAPLPPAPDQRADGFLRLCRFEPTPFPFRSRPMGVREHDRAHILAGLAFRTTTTPRNSVPTAHRLLGIGLMLPFWRSEGTRWIGTFATLSGRQADGEQAFRKKRSVSDRRGEPMTVVAFTQHPNSSSQGPAVASTRCTPWAHSPWESHPNESAVAAGIGDPFKASNSRQPAGGGGGGDCATLQSCRDAGVTLHGRSSLGIRWLQ